MQRNGDIESFVENHTTTTISFTVYMKSVQLSRMKKSGLEKVFKLDSNMSINNMHAFDHNSNIQKFTAPENIVDAYFPVRMQLYHDRKSVLECSKEYETSLIRNKAKFIEHVVDGKIDLIKGGTTKDNTVLQLADQDFMPIYELQKIMSRNEHVNSNPLTFFEMDSDMKSKQFDYLLNMPLSSLTADKVESLVTEAEKTEQELNGIKKATPQLLWLSDLEKLETTLRKMKYR
jgi:DNA topoisomerase-2